MVRVMWIQRDETPLFMSIPSIILTYDNANTQKKKEKRHANAKKPERKRKDMMEDGLMQRIAQGPSPTESWDFVPGSNETMSETMKFVFMGDNDVQTM